MTRSAFEWGAGSASAPRANRWRGAAGCQALCIFGKKAQKQGGGPLVRTGGSPGQIRLLEWGRLATCPPPPHFGGYKFHRLTSVATQDPPTHVGGYTRSTDSRRWLHKIHRLTSVATSYRRARDFDSACSYRFIVSRETILLKRLGSPPRSPASIGRGMDDGAYPHRVTIRLQEMLSQGLSRAWHQELIKYHGSHHAPRDAPSRGA